MRLHLQAVGDDAVLVQLHTVAAAAGGGVGGDAEVAPDSSYDSDSGSSSSSSSSEEEDKEDEDEEPLDIITNYSELKQMIDGMDADDDGDEDGGGGAGGAGGGGAHRAERELLGALPLPVLGELVLTPEDAVAAAGTVQAILEGMIVVKVGRVGGQGGGLAAGSSGADAYVCKHVLEQEGHSAIFWPLPLPTRAFRLMCCAVGAAGAGRQPCTERGLRTGAGRPQRGRRGGGNLRAGCVCSTVLVRQSEGGFVTARAAGVRVCLVMHRRCWGGEVLADRVRMQPVTAVLLHCSAVLRCVRAVVNPLYALRYAGGEPMPAALQQGAVVYSVDRWVLVRSLGARQP